MSLTDHQDPTDQVVRLQVDRPANIRTQSIKPLKKFKYGIIRKKFKWNRMQAFWLSEMEMPEEQVKR